MSKMARRPSVFARERRGRESGMLRRGRSGAMNGLRTCCKGEGVGGGEYFSLAEEEKLFDDEAEVDVEAMAAVIRSWM